MHVETGPAVESEPRAAAKAADAEGCVLGPPSEVSWPVAGGFSFDLTLTALEAAVRRPAEVACLKEFASRDELGCAVISFGVADTKACGTAAAAEVDALMGPACTAATGADEALLSRLLCARAGAATVDGPDWAAATALCSDAVDLGAML
jgi:hypothetical protein